MDWVYILALLPAVLLYGNGRYLLGTAMFSLLPLWYYTPVFAAICWVACCIVALNIQRKRS